MWPGTRIPDGLRPCGSQELSADDIQIGERAGDEQPMGVFLKTPIADLHEAEHTFDDVEGMFDAAADWGLDTVTSPFDLVYDAPVPVTGAPMSFVKHLLAMSHDKKPHRATSHRARRYVGGRAQ